MTDLPTILFRLGLRTHLRRYKAKCHALRSAVLGDYSSVEFEGVSQRDPDRPEDQRRLTMDVELADLLVVEYEAGVSSDLMHHVRTLVLSASNTFPSIEFEDVDPLEAALMTGYLKRRLEQCSAREPMQRALTSYIIDGLGFVVTWLRDGVPVVDYADTLDAIWDPRVALQGGATWYGLAVRRPLAVWVDLFGEGPFRDLLDGADRRPSLMEAAVELVYYWDVDGPDGTQAVVRSDRLHIVDDPSVAVEGPLPNDHFTVEDGYRRPRLPMHPTAFMIAPSTNYPVSMTELMLPHQLSKRAIERYMHEIARRGVPFYQVPKGAMDEGAREAFARGMVAELVEVDGGGVTVMPPLGVPREMVLLHQLAERMLVQQGGVNPYASGSPVGGTSYAAEVNAIQANASLVSSAVGIDHAMHWESVAKGILALARYDQTPVMLVIDGQRVLFGMGTEAGPIYDYVVEGADAVVSRDATQFMAREERMAFARQKLEVAMAVMAIAPKSVSIAYEAYLRAAGERNVAAHFEQPLTDVGIAHDAQTEAQVSTQ